MHLMGITANIMSLVGLPSPLGHGRRSHCGGRADHKKLDAGRNGRQGSYKDVVISAVKEVGTQFFRPAGHCCVVYACLHPDGMEDVFSSLWLSQRTFHGHRSRSAITLDPAIRLLFTHMDPYISGQVLVPPCQR